MLMEFINQHSHHWGAPSCIIGFHPVPSSDYQNQDGNHDVDDHDNDDNSRW